MTGIRCRHCGGKISSKVSSTVYCSGKCKEIYNKEKYLMSRWKYLDRQKTICNNVCGKLICDNCQDLKAVDFLVRIKKKNNKRINDIGRKKYKRNWIQNHE